MTSPLVASHLSKTYKGRAAVNAAAAELAQLGRVDQV